MWPARIAFAIAAVWSAFCLALAGVVFFNLSTIEPPERYIALVLGLAMLYMGGSIVTGMIWPPKKKDPNAPIEIPPLQDVHGRTEYRDSGAMERNALLILGIIFLVVSLSAARQQPMLLVLSAISVGVLIGAGVKIWRQMQYGRARLVLEGPARRGDVMRGVITTSGFGWAKLQRGVHAEVELAAYRIYRSGRTSRSVLITNASATTSTERDGNDLTVRFTVTIPIIDLSEGRFSWNVQLETRGAPKYEATFLIDVA